MEDGCCIPGDKQWRVLEFYSGIGGMRYSLMKAGLNAKLVEAFDINNTANDVYEHNFGDRPFQGNIQSLSAADLDNYEADAWLLSPPCQPYTRQGLQKHSADARSFSFLKILEHIPQTKKPPLMIFVENVVGFETSDTRAKMVDTLAKSDFVTQEFILSPLQFGVPYSRPRYFCLAKRKPLSFKYNMFNNQLLQSPSTLYGNFDNVFNSGHDQQPEVSTELLQNCQPIERFLEFKMSNDTENSSVASINDSTNAFKASEKIDEANKLDLSSIKEYLVPQSLIERWGSAMDIVYPDSRRCCCFTKSYYRYVKGTGSLLAIAQVKNKEKSSLGEQCLRYFTPRESGCQFSFIPRRFSIPAASKPQTTLCIAWKQFKCRSRRISTQIPVCLTDLH